jgi:hypothetical protein
MTQQQVSNKLQLMMSAAILTAITFAKKTVPGDIDNAQLEQLITTQHERWYQFLTKAALPDETVYVSPVDAQPTPFVPSDPNQLQALAKAVAQLLALIPGPASQTAAAIAGAVANTPLPKLGAAAT